MRRLKLALASLAMVAIANAQSEDRVISPTKGFQPSHSYALSDIESIDKATGTLSLHIPITQLPPGPGGFTAGLTLSYNDRYWETVPHYDGSSGNTFYGLRQSAYGGWRLKMAPELEFEYLTQNTADDTCVYSNTIFQMWIVNPDGSRNQLYLSQPSPDILACPVGTYDLGTINTGASSTWYTADGSYRRIVIDPETGTSGVWPMTASWTVYEQDGSSIRIDVGANAAYFFDRNGNRITVTYSATGTTSTELMSDAYGRTISLLHDFGNQKDVVTQIGHDGDSNNPLTWTVQYANFPAWPYPPEMYRMVNGPGNQYIAAVPTGLPLASSLTLPNNLSYTFTHGALLKELSQVILPTGATANYSYLNDGACCGTIWYWDALLNPVESKTLTHDGLTDTWTYDFHVASGTTIQSDFIAPDGSKTNHQYIEVSFNPSASYTDPGLLLQITNPDGSAVRREWAESRPYEMPVRGVGMNNWVQRELTTTASSSGQPVATSIQVFTIDKNGNRTSREERGWVAYDGTTPASSSATLLRKTINTYVVAALDSTATGVDTNAYSYPSPPSPPRNLVAGSETQNGSGTVVSRSEFNYTETSPSRTVGNLVDEYRWDSTQASSIASGATLADSGPNSNAVRKHYTYSANGNLATATDERGHTVTYTSGSVSCPPGTFSDLYRTAMQRGGLGSVQQNWTYGYNCYSGMRTSINDPNSLATTITFDRYSRPIKIAEGGLRTTQHYYNDNSRWIVSLDDASSAGDQATVNVYRYDQLGRIRLAQKLETTTDYATAGGDETLGIQVQTVYQYNAGSTDVLVSNPSRPSDNTETTRGWTATRRDIVGRPCAQETFDGAALPALASACGASSGATARTSYSYDATVNWTKARVTDPAGATRDLYSDALARLIAVVEDPGSSNYANYYGYNARDNLETVQQAGTCNQTDPIASPCTGGVFRTFAYTSLNRLSSATNPESGTIQYGYDKTGNLVKRQISTLLRCAGAISGSDCDATAYASGYDDLNRITAQNYSDLNTPGVTYLYDTADSGNRPANCAVAGGEGPIGHLASAANSVSTNYYYYDKLGYTECSRQKTGSSYDFTYILTPQGQRRQIVYPSGRTVTATIDNAGRIAKVCGAAACVPSSNYYAGDGNNSSIGYAPHGAIAQMKLGNGLFESSVFNGRLQLTDRKLGTTAGGSDVWRLQNGFSATQNNGNLLLQTETVPAWSAAITTQYLYDNLNRLKLANENPSNAANPTCPDASSRWCEGYSYDAYGNRMVPARDGIGPPATDPPGFNSANQVSGTNWHYDVRGNLDQSPGPAGTVTYLYNGENLQIGYCPNDTVPANCTQDTNSGRTVYAYDGEGRRVSQSTSSSSTTYVYDADGQLAGEYGSAAASGGTVYLTDDHLGSTRVVTDSAQGIVTRRDYLPFGEEIPASARTGRSGIAGYSSDGGVRVKFTGKERDAETGLDYFDVRYFSGAQGRFTSPDTPGYSSLRNPQAWNLYAYTLNNPLKYVDPDGHEVVCQGNPDDCRKAAAAATGNAAARVGTTTTITQHKFLWKHWTTSKTTITVSGDLASFRALGQNASRLADLVSDKREFGFNASSSTWKGSPIGFWATLSAPGERPLYGGGQSVTPSEDYYPESFVDPHPATYFIDTDAQESGIPPSNMGEKTAHELLGHLWGEMIAGHKAKGPQAAQNKQDSLDAENAVRRLDPQRGQKTVHH